MELSRAGADLFGEAPAALLLALSRRTSGTSGRELGRLAGVSSPSTAHRSLAALAKTGLVTATQSSHATLYGLNRNHALWKPVLAILQTPAKIEHMIDTIVTDSVGAAATVAVFGSVARGDADAESDIDIALIIPDVLDPESGAQVTELLVDQVGAFTGNTVQVVVITQSQLARMVAAEDPLVGSWASDSRTIAGPDLKRTINDLSA